MTSGARQDSQANGGQHSMRHVDLHIIQGTAVQYPPADINIVIDVIRDHLLGLNAVKLEDIQYRIKTSRPAQKFFDAGKPAFDERELAFCTEEVSCDFVMQVDKRLPLPRIIKKQIA